MKIIKILSVKPTEMIHIGDSKDFDYISPKKIGIQSYLLDREKNEEGNNILHNLTDFLKIVKLNKK